MWVRDKMSPKGAKANYITGGRMYQDMIVAVQFYALLFFLENYGCAVHEKFGSIGHDTGGHEPHTNYRVCA